MVKYGSNPFARLPIEINQMIASYLDLDNDLLSFRCLSKITNNAINGDGFSFWRRRFLSMFEKPIGYQENIEYKISYKRRRRVLSHPPTFRRGASSREILCLEVLRDLVLEAYSNSGRGHFKPIDALESLNLKHLTKFFQGNDKFSRTITETKSTHRNHSRKSKPVNPLLLTIQVLMAPCILKPHYPYQLAYRFPESQRVVYAHAEERPIFGRSGHDIDMEWVLHQLNFWQVHMTKASEYTLYTTFSNLSEHDLPRFWTSQLSKHRSTGNERLGKHWKGSYAFVDRALVAAIRAGYGEADVIQDEFSSEAEGGVFQDLTLVPVDDESSDLSISAGSTTHYWPWEFEQHLKALVLPEGKLKTRAQHRSASPDAIAELRARSYRFRGEGHDIDEDFLADGWLNPMPVQNGVPGWRRMTMMKYFLLDDESIDYDALWAYEGVVLPGSQIILGRWWSPHDGTGEMMYSGPFILWCVDSGQAHGIENGKVES